MKVSFKYFLLLLHSNLVSSGKKLPNFPILATGNLLKSLLELNQKILGEKFSYFFLFQTFDILFKCLLQNDEASKYKQAWFKKFTSQPDKRWQWSMEDSLDWQCCLNVLVDKKSILHWTHFQPQTVDIVHLNFNLSLLTACFSWLFFMLKSVCE